MHTGVHIQIVKYGYVDLMDVVFVLMYRIFEQCIVSRNQGGL